MTGPEVDVQTWRTVSFGRGGQWSVPQLGLALLGCVSAAVFLHSLTQASDGFDSLLWALVVVPLVTAAYAGSAAPLAFWGLMLASWFLVTPGGSFSLWSIPAGLALLVGHASAALAATTPPTGGFSARVLRRWLRPVALAALAAPLLGILANAFSGDGLEASSAAYVIGLGGLALGVLLLRTEPPA